MKYFHLFSVLILVLIVTLDVSRAQILKTGEPYPDDPAAREEYDYIRLRDPRTKEIPPYIGQKEYEFASKLPKHDPFGNRSNAPLSDEWLPAGPSNQSGRIQAIGIDILDENNMLAGSASGGVWRSIDGGASWVKVTLPNDEQSVSAIVQDTRKGRESTWYYSTGELLSTTGRRETSNIRTHSWGNGIYKSIDNGASWNALPATVTTSEHTAAINFTGIWNLALDTRNLSEDIIYAACYGGIMRSSDGGTTWTNVLGDDSLKCFNSEIVIGSAGTHYAAIGTAYDGTVSPHQGVWRSTDGIHWANISGSTVPSLIRRSRLGLSQSNDNILYFLTETPKEWSMPDTEFTTTNSFSKYTYLSGDGSGSGGKWQARTVPYLYDAESYYYSLGGYALMLAVHPDDAEKVFIGGTNLYYSATGFNGTSSFLKIGGYPFTMMPGTLHPDMHAFLFSRTDHSKIFLGTDGGVAELDDFIANDDTWKTLDNGLASAQVYHSSLDHSKEGDYFILSGLQDNNSFETQSASFEDPWYVVSGGDGMTTAMTNGGSQLFGSWQSGNIACFYNDGVYISYIGNLPPPSSLSVSTFFTNYILEPNYNNELYQAETDQLWRYDGVSVLPGESGNIQSRWTEIAPVFDALHPLGAFITTFGFATDVQDRLFFGTNIGKVFRVDDAAQAPSLHEISGSDFPKDGFVAGIDVDPIDANHIIVVFSNYHVQSVFRTTDGGKNWSAIGGNLEELPEGAGSGPSVRCAKILHTPKGTIYYVGTSVGLYSTMTIDGANTIWAQEGTTTIGNLIVESLDARQSDGMVIASTQGGGVFRSVPTSGVSNSPSPFQQSLILEQNYPNPFSNRSAFRFTIAKRCEVSIDLYNALGEKMKVLAHSSYEGGSYTIDLSGKTLSAGNYFLHVTAGSAVATKMITIVK
ncbi:MAG: T9SS type A sorting domain-containing protein [Bacteroidota bacterium]|nr:T9SS type A sorting domain-containing protein [Bacteroidota bacterium]